jgi:predicted nucleic acid-binding protein
MLAVVDTGPLVAVADAKDSYHEQARAFMEGTPHRLIIPVLAIGEASFLILSRLGPAAEARFIAGISEMNIESPHSSDWRRMSDLMSMYRDFPLGTVDAYVIALAERLNTDLIVTFDLRHFRAVRPRHVDAFRILPD